MYHQAGVCKGSASFMCKMRAALTSSPLLPFSAAIVAQTKLPCSNHLLQAIAFAATSAAVASAAAAHILTLPHLAAAAAPCPDFCVTIVIKTADT